MNAHLYFQRLGEDAAARFSAQAFDFIGGHEPGECRVVNEGAMVDKNTVNILLKDFIGDFGHHCLRDVNMTDLDIVHPVPAG
ncbi:hypothetical protein D3C87_1475100 [compost metagenome]